MEAKSKARWGEVGGADATAAPNATLSAPSTSSPLLVALALLLLPPPGPVSTLTASLGTPMADSSSPACISVSRRTLGEFLLPPSSAAAWKEEEEEEEVFPATPPLPDATPSVLCLEAAERASSSSLMMCSCTKSRRAAAVRRALTERWV